MSLHVEPLAALQDNYIWVLHSADGQTCGVIDPGAAEPVLNWLAAHPHKTLTWIGLTHHHSDHTAGVATLKRQIPGLCISGPEGCPGAEDILADGDVIEVLGVQMAVLHLPGHTLDHLAYFCPQKPPLLFCGDTLFGAGCGRVFEGTMAQMHNTLQRLTNLPDETCIYPAHEYTRTNLVFAQQTEPDNKAIRTRLQTLELQPVGTPSLPTTLAVEKFSNPFLRTHLGAADTALNARFGPAARDSLERFTQLRTWRNQF